MSAFADPNPRAKPIATTTNTFPPQNTSSTSANGARGGLAGKRYLWAMSFYQQFFDVDTNAVLKRCLCAVFPKDNFLDVLDGNPDLYGPFWIATTVVVILFLTGSINAWLAAQGESYYGYDFRLLSGAAGLVYGYTFVIPFGLWASLRWSGSEAANVLECWALYGYANVIWMPVALISWSPIDILNYVFVGVGFVVSALFLARNLYPIIMTTPHQRAKLIFIIVLILHAGLAIAIKILFFAYVVKSIWLDQREQADSSRSHKSPAARLPVDTPTAGNPVSDNPGASDGSAPAPDDGTRAMRFVRW